MRDDNSQQQFEQHQQQEQNEEIELIKKYLSYDPDSGLLSWRLNFNKHKIGEIAGSKTKLGYINIQLNYKLYCAHRLAWVIFYGDFPMYGLDHINGIKYDNRITNLRDVPHRVNMQNYKIAKSNSSSGLLGVHWHKNSGKWRAVIAVDKITHSLGLFENKYDAYEVYLEAKRKLHSGCTI